MAPIDEALKALDSLEAPNFEYARRYNVDRNTLARRHQGLQGIRDQFIERVSLLSHQQQQDLVSYMNKLSARGLSPTTDMEDNYAKKICGKQPGKNWCAGFMKIHAKILVSEYLQGLDISRKKAGSAIMYSR